MADKLLRMNEFENEELKKEGFETKVDETQEYVTEVESDAPKSEPLVFKDDGNKDSFISAIQASLKNVMDGFKEEELLINVEVKLSLPNLNAVINLKENSKDPDQVVSAFSQFITINNAEFIATILKQTINLDKDENIKES